MPKSKLFHFVPSSCDVTEVLPCTTGRVAADVIYSFIIFLLHLVLLLALQIFVSYGLLSSSLRCFSYHSQLTPVVKLYFSHISSETIIIITIIIYCSCVFARWQYTSTDKTNKNVLYINETIKETQYKQYKTQ